MGDLFKKHKNLIIIGSIALIVGYIVYQNRYKILRLFNPSSTNPSPEAVSGEPISNSKKIELEKLAGKLYSDIYSTPLFGHTYSIYKEAANLHDDYLEYLATFYKVYLASGHTLYDDLAWEWFNNPSSQGALMDRLKILNLK